MAINFTSLFTKLGRLGKLILASDQFGAAVPTTLTQFFSNFTGTEQQRPYVASALGQAQALPYAPADDLAAFNLASLGANTLLREVQIDNPAAAGTLPAALGELVRQMVAHSESVKRSVCTASVTPQSGNAGTGVVFTTVTRGDGSPIELCVAETARLACTADSYSGTAVAGAEPFTFTGSPASSSPFAYDWPAGSGAAATLVAIDAGTGPTATRNVLANGGFELFTTANVPDNWAIDAGTAGTQILQSTTTVYAGASALQFVGGAATAAAISQTFSTVIPLPLSAYGANLWVRVDTVPAGGILTIDLYDPTAAAVVNDAAGSPNTFSLTLSTLTANTWTNLHGVFRLPKVIPTGLKVRVRLSTALSGGSNLFLDHLAMALPTVPYPGGPGVWVFGGAVPFAAGDAYSVAVANDRAGASYAATFQALFERLFAMSGYGLQLPSTTGSATQPDTLITA